MEMDKLSKDVKYYVAHTGKTDKTSENNETLDKLAICLIKPRILNIYSEFAREQIQNKSTGMIDYTLEKLESLSLMLKK